MAGHRRLARGRRGLASAAVKAGDHTSDNLTLPGTGSTNATNLLEQRRPNQANASNPLVLEAHRGKLTDSSNQQAVDATIKNLRNTADGVNVVNPTDAKGSAFLSKSKKIAYVPVTLEVGQSDLTEDEAQQVLDAADPARPAGLDGRWAATPASSCRSRAPI